MIDGVRIFANRQRWSDSIVDLLVVRKVGDKKQYAQTVEWKPLIEGAEVPPTFHLPQNMAQVLIDALWDCGMRPTEGSGSAGSLKATQNHLEDMRKIVFKKILKTEAKAQ